MSIPYFATCARGLEPLLAEELRALAAEDVKQGRGGVDFAGDRALLYRANLCLRTAVRVLVPILKFRAENPDELYDAAKSIDWTKYLTLDHTFVIDSNVRDSRITHSLYASLRVKDAICDQFNERVGARPSVDRENPMVQLNLHIHRDKGVLSLDSSCDSLHKRGYRPVQTIAPLNEALAAGLILRSGWDPNTPFVDPMCGSATLPIEAAWIALDRPPGLTRQHFGFMGWLDFDKGEWLALRDEARDAARRSLTTIVQGSDQRRDVIEMAKQNAKSASVGHLLNLTVEAFATFQPPAGDPGTIMLNPPYGERIGEEKELRGLYKQIGRLFRERCPGWRCWVFTGNPRLAREIDMPVVEGYPFWNGKIECELLRYE